MKNYTGEGSWLGKSSQATSSQPPPPPPARPHPPFIVIPAKLQGYLALQRLGIKATQGWIRIFTLPLTSFVAFVKSVILGF